MKRIKLLPEEVFVKIAAGEVIDRPSAVVRELIDNSIDAGATRIIVTIEDGGIGCIVVTDNGSGISKENIPLALLQHATSKIEFVEDIYRISTNGFRGEALHAIQTVSKTSIISRTEGTDSGYQTRNYSDGTVEANIITPVGAPIGTTVKVSDIFYNIPARRKFLKSQLTELNNIKRCVIDKAFANIKIGFKLINNKKVIFNTGPDGSFEDRFNAIFDENGIEIYNRSITIDQIDIDLYYSPHDQFFSTRKYQSVFVNKRPVNLPFFYGAIDAGIRDFISTGRHPLVFCYIGIDPSRIDVNVHPAKREIRILDGDKLFNIIMNCIKSVYSTSVIKSVKHSPVFIKESNQTDSYQNKDIEGLFNNRTNSSEVYIYNKPQVFEDYKHLQTSTYDNMSYKVIGVFEKTYIIVVEPGKVIFVDQHALSEALIYRNKRGIFETKNEIEHLLIPILIYLDSWDKNIERNIDLLNKTGFEIEIQENNTLKVYGVPGFCLIKSDYNELTGLIEEFIVDNRTDQGIIDTLLIESSCKEAVKKGDELSSMVIDELIEGFYTYQITNCPHGRPVYFEVTRDLLDRSIQRKK